MHSFPSHHAKSPKTVVCTYSQAGPGLFTLIGIKSHMQLVVATLESTALLCARSFIVPFTACGNKYIFASCSNFHEILTHIIPKPTPFNSNRTSPRDTSTQFLFLNDSTLSRPTPLTYLLITAFVIATSNTIMSQRVPFHKLPCLMFVGGADGGGWLLGAKAGWHCWGKKKRGSCKVFLFKTWFYF